MRSSKIARQKSEWQILKLLSWVAFLFFYQGLTSVFTHLPPLIGVFFTYMVILVLQKQKTLKDFGKEWYFSLFYVTFAEQVHGFGLFSVVIAFVLFYYFICDWLMISFKSRQILIIVCVVSGYVGTYLISSLLSYVANSDFLKFDYEYAVYIGIEAALAIVLFRGRL